MLIRPATPPDIPAMRALEQQTDTAAHWSEREYDALFAPDAPRRMAMLAIESDDHCGFIIARCGVDDWEIENIVVAAAQRRRGVGSALVREIVHAARQVCVPAILLEVRESNLAARQLYEKMGFIQEGRRAAYYREPLEDALLLRFSMQNL